MESEYIRGCLFQCQQDTDASVQKQVTGRHKEKYKWQELHYAEFR